jgi:hypothetical protein
MVRSVEVSENEILWTQKPKPPGVVRWLGYLFGASLPERYREWVLFDTTGRTWILRHVTRGVLQLVVPIALVMVLLPAPLWLRILSCVAAGGPALLFSIGYLIETTDHRLVKAGYPSGYGEAIRKKRALEAQRTASARRRERAAARLQARRG